VTVVADRTAAKTLVFPRRLTVDETMGTVTVEANSTLVGETADTVGAAVLAVRPSGEKLTALPESTRPFEGGDTIYVLARPDVLRQLEGWATTPAPESESEANDEQTDQAHPNSGAPVDLDDSE